MDITKLLGHLDEARQDLYNISYTASKYGRGDLEQEVHSISVAILSLGDRIKRGEFGGTIPA